MASYTDVQSKTKFIVHWTLCWLWNNPRLNFASLTRCWVKSTVTRPVLQGMQINYRIFPKICNRYIFLCNCNGSVIHKCETFPGYFSTSISAAFRLGELSTVYSICKTWLNDFHSVLSPEKMLVDILHFGSDVSFMQYTFEFSFSCRHPAVVT